MYGTRKRRIAMQDKSNVSSNENNPSNNLKIPQKIPLTEATQTLRPRRGCKKNHDENNCKENNVPLSKSSATNKTFPETDTSLKRLLRSKSTSEVLAELPVSKKNVKKLKEENSSKNSILQSIQNLNFKNNKSNLKSNGAKSKAHSKVVYQNEENYERKIKISAPAIATQESGIMRKFPKWISDGMESLKRGKKRALNLDVYDIETDKDLMLEKSLTKKAVVKKARITKTKNYPTKPNSRTSAKTQSNKKCNAKKVAAKFPDNVCSELCSRFEKHKVEMAKTEHLASQKQADTERNIIHLHSKEVFIGTNTVVPNKESVQVKQLAASNKQKTLCSKVGKSSEKLETPEKCQHIGATHSKNEIETSLNLQSFPMPQSSSTPQNADKSNIPAQMLCSSFDVTLLEIPQSEEMQVDFSDSEFLSPEKATSDADEIHLFDSPINEMKTEVVKAKAKNKPSAVKNLSSSLGEKLLKETKGDTQKNSQPMVTDLPQKEKVSQSPTKENLLQLEREILQFPAQEEYPLLYTSTTSEEKLNVNQDKQTTPEEMKKNTPRPKRACQQNKPVIEESSDIGSLLEDVHEITLFESPEKEGSHKEETVECSPSKTVLKNLFPAEFNVFPVKVINVEERVLKPRKSYHSPAQFRRHVMKAKRENKVQKKAQTKQDKLIEILNNHFSELENMDLCVE